MTRPILSTKSTSKQFVVNVSSNTVVMLLNVLIGLWYTPYLIQNLGVAVYGLVILATSLTIYMSIFNASIDNAVGRFLTIDIRRQEFDLANRTFNTAMWSAILICIFLLPVVVIVAYRTPYWFDVPVGQDNSVIVLFMTVMLAYLLIIPRSVFTSSAFAHNRLDLKNLITLSNTVVRVLFVLSFFSLFMTPQAWQVGVATLLGSFISLLISISICRRLTPELTLHLYLFDKTKWSSMVGMSGWLFIDQIGSLLFLNIDLIVVNRYLGAEVQGQYGSVLQLIILLRTLSTVITTALTPIALGQLARQDMSQMALMTRKAIKWMGLFVALPIGGLIGFSSPFLRLWLGDEFVVLTPLLILLSAHLCVNLAVRPLFPIQTALNKVRIPGLVTLLLGILNLGLAIWWVEWDQLGMGVALAGAVVLTLKNTVFTPIYGARYRICLSILS